MNTEKQIEKLIRGWLPQEPKIGSLGSGRHLHFGFPSKRLHVVDLSDMRETFGELFKLGLFLFDVVIVAPFTFVFALLPVSLGLKLVYMGIYFVATQSPLWIGIYRRQQHEKTVVWTEAWETSKPTERLVKEYEEMLKKQHG